MLVNSQMKLSKKASNSNSFIKYIVKEKQKKVIILSSDEEDNNDSFITPDPRPLKIRKIEEGSSKSDPIQLSDDEQEQEQKQQQEESSITSTNEALSDLTIESDSTISLKTDMFNENQPQISKNILSPTTSIFEYDILSDIDDNLFVGHITDVNDTTTADINLSESDMVSASFKHINLSELDMEPPTQVKTIIPNHLNKLEYLRTIEMYLQSVTNMSILSDSEDSLFTDVLRRSARQNVTTVEKLRRATPRSVSPMHDTTNTNIPIEPMMPYVPSQVWYNSTWEDWAQLNTADILHYPFQPYEIETIKQCVSKQLSKKKQREIDFWQTVSMDLPGRSPLECKCFWTDYLNGTHTSYNHIYMIRSLKQPSYIHPHQLLSKRTLLASKVANTIKKSLWSCMSKEKMITGGSGDAITIAMFHDPIKDVRVAVGSLCDENIQYNVPGNLRLWDSATETCLMLNGHQTYSQITDQNIWRTVTDIKMSKDEAFIFSASHDGSANIWRTRSGKLVSTLRYHSKPINQLAVNYATNENVLATCSNDGTATVWYIGRNGKTGSGVICELDVKSYSDPHVECIEFGHHSTDNLLFLGINNKDVDRPGYVVAFDVNSGKSRIRFDSMKGCVSTLAVSRSGRYIVSGNYNRFDNMAGDGFIHLHDFRKPQLASKFYSGHPDVNVVSISPCERYVASGNADKEKSEVIIFDVRNHKKAMHTLSHDQSLVNQSLIAPDSSIGIGGLYWTLDSRTMITGGGDSTVKIWSLEGATRLLKSYPTSNCVTSLNVHEETMTIAAGVSGAQGIVHVWRP